MADRADSPSDRVAQLLAEVGRAPTIERARDTAEELVRALVTFYGDALERVLDVVHAAAGERSEAIFAALCDDRYVENVLALHGLHPLGLEDRVLLALESIRPYLASHEGNVELVRVDDGIAYVRLGGSCDGCRSSAATLKGAVETAILERVPEITAVRDVAAPPLAAEVAERTNSLQLHDFVDLAAVPELAPAGIAHVRCFETPVLLVGHGDALYAYRDACPVCLLPLTGAALEWPFVRCAACERRFDVVRAGRGEDDERARAEPFPLVRDGERIRISIPLGV